MRYFGVHGLRWGLVWNVLERFNCWSFRVHVRTHPGRAGVSMYRPPEGVIIVVDLSSR